MSSKTLKSGVTATVASMVILASFSSALAGDHELWREQVKKTPVQAITLEEGGNVAAAGNYKFWREQIKNSRNRSAKRYIARTLTNQTALPGYVFWREQVKAPVEEISQAAAASR